MTTMLQNAPVTRFLAALKSSRISMSQYSILSNLLLLPDKRGHLTTVATMSGFTSANLTGMADRLEKLGLAERKPVEGDRRAFWLVITSAGEAIVAKLQSISKSAAA